MAPQYISDVLMAYSPVRALQLMDQDLVSVPQARTKKYGHWAFAYAAVKLYNEFPLSIRQSPSLNSSRLA